MSTPRRELLIRTLQTLGGLATAQGLGWAGPASADERSTLLLECHVAGTTYAGLPDHYEEKLVRGLRLTLWREADNPADPLAIRVQDLWGRKLGYVPRAKNEVLARLLDAGVSIYAEVVSWERVNTWLKIEVRIVAQLHA